MSGTSFSFGMPWTANVSGDSGGARYLAPPFNARAVDRRDVLLLRPGRPEVHRLALELVQVLGHCGRWRTVQEHAQHATRALQAQPQQVGAIRQTIEELIKRGLLESEKSVLDELTGQRSQGEPEPIAALFVRTCNRPETLERLLESLAANPAPGLRHCVVLDDGTDEDSRARTRQIVDRLTAGLHCRLTLIDRARRRRLLDTVAAATGIEPGLLRWSIEGDEQDEAPSYGAGLNTAVLLGAGERIAVMDDDATLEAFELPDSSTAPAFCRRQSARLHFPEPDWDPLGRHYARIDGHPLDQHATFLGASAGDLAGLAGNETRALLDDLDPQLLHELSGSTRTRLTSSGTLGDPGTAGIQWLLAEDPAQLRPLCESEGRCRDLLAQRRLARAAGRPQATTAFALMTTTMTGIDNRELLLPTQARGPNEDLLFGALVDYLHPGTLQVGLPHMLYHMRPSPRRWQPEDFDRPRGIQRGGFLARHVEGLIEPTRSGSPETRLALLGASLRNLARAGKDELAWQLRRELLDTRADTLERIADTRRTLKPPAWLDELFQRSAAAHGEISDNDEQRLLRLADELPAFLDHYATALEAWPAAWRHCRATGLDDLLDQTQ